MSSKFLAMDEWLQRIGLRHPFRSATTSERDEIDQLCDPFCWIGDLLSSPDDLIIWGRPGTGKSAYRYILAQTAKDGAEHWLPVEICRRQFAAVAPRLAAGQRLKDDWFAALVIKLALEQLTAQPGAEQVAHLPLSASHRAQARERTSRDNSFQAQLERLAELLDAGKYVGCVVLVDEVDDVRGAKGNEQVQRDLVYPLFLEWFEQPHWRWRAFLPEALRRSFTGQYAISAKVQQWSLEWRPEHLRHMIADRLLFYSERQQYETIGDLCDEELSPVVDAELIALSRGSPRNAITLASMLFRQHCQQPSIPTLIGHKSWLAVCSEWETRARDEIEEELELPAQTPASAEPVALQFDQSGTILVGATEITRKLNRRRYRLLKLLYDHQGAVVTKEELIDVGWPPSECSDPSEVTDDMIRQLINHLREILSPDIEFIESVPGRGYRLFAAGLGPRKPKAAG